MFGAVKFTDYIRSMNTTVKIFGRIGSHLLKVVTSKYFLVLAFAGIWMIFFDRYNLISQYQMKAQIEQLQKDEAHYRKAIEKLDYQEGRLTNDAEELERIAREKYYMKKAGEDVFIVVDEK